ncbi:MAG: hypothetical protein WCC93_05065 [Chthoniobacterales bacterium]
MGGLTNDVRQFWWAVLAIALLTILTRLPSLLHLQAIDDEETYSAVANVIVDGGWPSGDWETVTPWYAYPIDLL